jgi:hypothetical protein
MGKYGIFVNDDDEPVWESELESSEVDQVVISTARGEVATIGTATNDTWIRIRVNERAQVETYLGQAESIQQQEYREKFEQEPENMDAYVEADPETGEPMTGEQPASEQDQTKEEASLSEF